MCDSCNQVRKNLSQPIGKRTHIPTKVLIYWCVSPSIFRSLFRHFCFENLVTKYYRWAYKRVDPFSRLIATLLFVFSSQNKKKILLKLNWITARDPAKCFTSHSTLLPSQTWNLKKKKKKMLNLKQLVLSLSMIGYTSSLTHFVIWIIFF